MRAALVAVLSVVLWQAVVVRTVWSGNWTGLFCIGSQVAMPPDASVGVIRVPDSGGYDAQFYRLMAHDPFFERGWHSYIDDARFRYRRILIPLAAFALALGQDRFIDAAYIGLILTSVFLGVLWTGRWFEVRGHSGWYGLLFLLVPATLTSVDRMLLDGPLCAAFAGFAWKMSKGERPWGILLCAPLVKETGMFLAFAMGVMALGGRRWREAFLVAVTQVPALAWFAFVTAHTASSGAQALFTWPLIGHVQRLLTVRAYPGPRVLEMVLQGFDVAAIASLLACIVIGLVYFWPYAGAVEITSALFALVGLAMANPVHLVEAYGFARPVAPLLWAVMVHGVAERKWWMAAAPLGLTGAVGLSLASETVRALLAL